MGFLKKLFGGSDRTPSPQQGKNPENTRLNFLLDTWSHHQSNENYRAVMQEITEGNSFLLLPSVNDGNGSGDWTTLEAKQTLKLTSVYDMDGLQVLGVFSSEKELLAWAKAETQYTAMRSQDAIEFCQQHGIDRIVINSNQPTMFVMERDRRNIKTTTIEKETSVLVGTPLRPLPQPILDKLSANFKNVSTIEEAYQYAQNMNGESSIVLGIKMLVVSDNSRAALHNALNDALKDEKLDQPLDIFVLEDEHWLQTVRNISNSLFYKRNG